VWFHSKISFSCCCDPCETVEYISKRGGIRKNVVVEEVVVGIINTIDL